MKAPPGLPHRQRRGLEGLALLLLVISAILFQQSATASWIEMQAGDGARYRVSPIGVMEFTAATAPARQCRWWPKAGDPQLCAMSDTGGSAHMTWLRRAYPLTVAALWLSVLALFLNALRVPRQAPAIGVMAAVIPSILGAAALWSVWSHANGALAVLAGLQPRSVGELGVIGAGIVLTTTSALLLLIARR